VFPRYSTLSWYVPAAAMFVVSVIVFCPFSVPVATMLPVMVSVILMFPFVIGLPVVLSVTVVVIVVFFIVLFTSVAVVWLGLCATFMFTS